MNEICEKVYYYKRNSYLLSTFSKIPFIVKSRSNQKLINVLNKDNYPILFEGLHTTFPVFIDAIDKKRVFVRTHNIEHNFYKGLTDSETSIFKKNFFKYETDKLNSYERILKKAHKIFTISHFEQTYFAERFGKKAIYIPVFFKVQPKKTHFNSSKKDLYVLYHGNLKVSENIKAVLFLIDVYKNSEYKLIIASRLVPNIISNKIENIKNIDFREVHTQKELENLLETAHVNALPTFQKTGIKLKLINTLTSGKYVIANNEMIQDTGLESLVYLANSKKEFLNKTAVLFDKQYSKEIEKEREKVLDNFNPTKSAQKIIDEIFN